jgi:hypothetical protein
MFAKSLKIIALITLLLPQVALALSNEQAEAIMESSGLSKMLERLPDQVVMGAQASQNPNSGVDFDVMSAAMIRATDQLDLSGALLTELTSKVDEMDAEILLAFFQSDLGEQITQAEIDAGTPEAALEMQQRAQALLLSEQRVELAQRMDRVMRSTDIAMEVQEVVMVSVVEGMLGLQGQDSDYIEQVLSSVNNELQASYLSRRGIISQTMVLTYVYTYNKLPVDDVKSYVDFLEQTESQRFYDIVTNTLVSGMELWATTFAAEMVEATKNKVPAV